MAERNGIPTMYRGVLMRSRTEARWAALFDAVEWPWRYEPRDYKGWIPDFEIEFPAGTMLVEIKSTGRDFRNAQTKIDLSGYEGPAMILAHEISGRFAGRIRDRDGGAWAWCQIQFFQCISCGWVSVHAYDGDWTCRACGDGHGNAHVGHADMEDRWTEAGNRVQWKPEAA